MGWTIQYRARGNDADIYAFVQDANSQAPWLSWGCEKYRWEVKESASAHGFTKVEFALLRRRDFLAIVKALKQLSERWPHIRIEACDDYVLGDWRPMRNLNIGELQL